MWVRAAICPLWLGLGLRLEDEVRVEVRVRCLGKYTSLYATQGRIVIHSTMVTWYDFVSTSAASIAC